MEEKKLIYKNKKGSTSIGSLPEKAKVHEVLAFDEGVLSPEKKELNPVLWTSDKKLKPEWKELVLSRLNDELSPEEQEQVLSVDITGSNTGFYYDETSDLDVEILMDMTEDVLIEKDFIHRIPQDEENLPGTEIALNYFFRAEPPVSMFSNRYSIRKDAWLLFDNNKITIRFTNEIIETGLSWVRKIELDMAELKRDLMDYAILSKDLLNYDFLEDPDYISKLKETKLAEILSGVDILNVDFRFLKKFRKDAFKVDYDYESYTSSLVNLGEDPNLTLNNITYKLAERYGHLTILKKVKNLYKVYVEDKNLTNLVNGLNEIFGVIIGKGME